MAYKFNTPAGQTVDRKLYLVCGNYGTAQAPQRGAVHGCGVGQPLSLGQAARCEDDY